MVLCLRLLLSLICLCLGPVCLAEPIAIQQEAQGEGELSPEMEEYKGNLQHHLRRNAFLKEVEFEWVWDYADFVVLVQPPTRAQEGYVEKVAKLRSAESQRMNQAMQEGMAKDYGLALRQSAKRMVIVVLKDPSEFGKYLEVVFRQKVNGLSSYYNPVDRLLVLCESPYQKRNLDRGEAHLTERHWRGMQIVHGYSARSGSMPGPWWLQHGLANEISGNNSRERTRKGMGKATHWAFYSLCLSIQNDSARPVSLPPLGDMFKANNNWDLVNAAAARSKAAEVPMVDNWYVYRDFRATAGALVQYLTSAASEEIQESMHAFIEAAMKGKLKNQSFEGAFKDVDWAQIERDFWAYVWKRRELEAGKGNFDSGGINALLTSLAPLAGEGATGGRVALSKPLDLLGMVKGSEAQIALAISEVLAGDAESAVERLGTALEKAEENSAPGERLEKELARIQDWILARDAFLEHLIAKKKKLRLTLEGKKFVAAIGSVKDGQVHFASSNRDLESLALNRLEAVQLASQMVDRKNKFDGGWAVAYPPVVDPDTKAKRYLRGKAPELVDLAEDDKNDYPNRELAILAASSLLTLAGSDAEDGKAVSKAEGLEHANFLWTLRSQVDWVLPMKQSLAYYASEGLFDRFDRKNLGELLSVEASEDEEGFVHLVYDFSDTDQLRDWMVDPPRSAMRKRWPATKSSDNSLAVKGGRLVGLGKASLSHVLEFSGRHSIAWSVQRFSGGSVPVDKAGIFRVGLCSGPDNRYVAVYDSLAIEIMNGSEGGSVFERLGDHRDFMDTVYEREMHHDGTSTVTVVSDGEEVRQFPCGKRVRGHPQIVVHSDYLIEFDDVEIVGKITPESWAAFRERWVGQQLSLIELGG